MASSPSWGFVNMFGSPLLKNSPPYLLPTKIFLRAHHLPSSLSLLLGWAGIPVQGLLASSALLVAAAPCTPHAARPSWATHGHSHLSVLDGSTWVRDPGLT